MDFRGNREGLGAKTKGGGAYLYLIISHYYKISNSNFYCNWNMRTTRLQKKNIKIIFPISIFSDCSVTLAVDGPEFFSSKVDL